LVAVDRDYPVLTGCYAEKLNLARAADVQAIIFEIA
jgi:hypothetical protein